jgi:hypothetical protein
MLIPASLSFLLFSVPVPVLVVVIVEAVGKYEGFRVSHGVDFAIKKKREFNSDRVGEERRGK